MCLKLGFGLQGSAFVRSFARCHQSDWHSASCQAVMEGKWKPAPGKCADGINGTGAGGIGGWTRGAENECDGFLVRLILLVKESS